TQPGRRLCQAFRRHLPKAGQGLRCAILSVLPGRGGVESKTQSSRRDASQSGRREGGRGAHASSCEQACPIVETGALMLKKLVSVQLSAMLNAIDRFWAGAFWSNLQNLAMIAALLLYRWFPNAGYAAAWGVFAGGVAQLIFILWAGAREGLWLQLTWPRWTPE